MLRLLWSFRQERDGMDGGHTSVLACARAHFCVQMIQLELAAVV